MLNKLFELVHQLGGASNVRACDRADHVLVEIDGAQVEFAALVRERAPYPGEVDDLTRQSAAAPHGSRWFPWGRVQPLLVTRYVSSRLGERLTAAGWSWIDAVGNCDLRGPGLRVHVRLSERPPARPGRLPMGPANLAIIRGMLSWSATQQWSTRELARLGETSSVVATQTMQRLEKLGLCTHQARGEWIVDPAALLDRFMSDYPGPRGSERYFYGEVDLRSFADWISSVFPGQIAVSADVGPDVLAPWRVPTTLIFYSRPTVDVGTYGELVEVPTLGAASLVQVFPKDVSVFPPSTYELSQVGGQLALADPVQMIWDLERLGGEDRDRAAHEVRQWLNR